MHDNQLAQQIARTIADEIGAQPAQAHAAIALLDEGASVPFIARYRKEVTGGLDDTQLRNLETRLTYLRELEERRAAILSSIGEQGKLSDELRNEIVAADTKSRLEDLYLPYKPKRRTRAQIAREAGLEPLADGLLADPTQSPDVAAAAFIDAEKGVADSKAALEGARAILMERWGEDAALVGELRSWLGDNGVIRARVAEGKEEAGAKYRDYFDHAETLAKIPSHRLLALFRARREEILYLDLDPGSDAEAGHQYAEGRVARNAGISNEGRPADRWLLDACRLTWRAKLHMHLLLDLFNQAREKAEAEAIAVFGDNLKDLMLAAPAGPRVVLGLDPGIRTGCKIAVVDATGKLVVTETIYPHEPKRQWDQSLQTIKKLCMQHNVELIAIGNGTASRETDKLAGEAIALCGATKLQKVVVSEAGASVYSASEFAAKEFPNLDVSLRGAVSIARRLQDPLAELVKIEPKAIGVGQYQHDVDQYRLAKALEARVEDCVNAVGVYVNTASAALLSRVSGLSGTVAENIVRHRDDNGPFKRRKDLLKVPRLGDKTFEQCAGFLRIADGDEPLDVSAVHPEAYPVVERIVSSTGKPIKALLGDGSFLRGLKPEMFTDDQFGVPTVRDILKELEKPGRDPRPEFKAAQFAEGIEDIKHLKPGMVLEGVVSNVAAFGAFVDIGVHQDGLVHISALSETFVKDPRDVVKAGDIVKVKVLEVDVARKRIALTCRLSDTPPAADGSAQPRDARGSGPGQGRRDGGGRGQAQANSKPRITAPPADNALAAAFARAKRS
ncbi:Tex family protein [Xanthomonas citri pv. glycines]|uniref:RNA-binding transcriptional accessory protein n=1 Tax=Xanthomonas campestris pv. glycines TaxID=473421 RepID=A0AAX0I1Q6_XANCG|nr:MULTISPECIES: Tex family protein [Xanthomonas]AOY62868.1 RNA-binding transcriptional accessory protein [Xanthomonas citri pv. glycines str. 8ra]ARV23375.1 RNA-binding transcriptional accessory protein [Xanthomonas citri pv. glycines str. 12-2]EWC52488.1 transcription accessory protein [Xanthomonas citri pv. glycines str. 8ra]OEY90695.1 RNA-binding transcriptional accessory protein [Xanthomonas citri pv. glycines]OOX05575.1 RNA-binding transcriptional accessory protein [Xanthomonas citri pv.